MAGSVGTLALADVAWAMAFKAEPAPDWPDLATKEALNFEHCCQGA